MSKITNQELIKLVQKNKDLFWDCQIENVNEEAVVERFLNYWEIDDIKNMIKLIWYDTVRSIFLKQISWQRINYNHLSTNFFTYFFNLNDKVSLWDIIPRTKRNVALR